ncbi:alanine aminotransferase 1-like [Dryobates pubescens]|uniref:alanine aminotransferase 1-like n=1 Tax=Dryobates pubescens TaxID=118200 RepID=UPI0023B8B3A0|nr:alanine aminotransferase 1-like [Dryobates pubescens]
MATTQIPAPGPAMAAVGTSGDASGSPPALLNPRRWHPPLSPLQTLLEQATTIEEELAQGQDKPFTEVICCYSGDAAATGHQPLTILQQVAAICAYPTLLGAEDMPREAKRRAGQILQHLQGGSPGAYNLEYVTDRVAPTVAQYLARRDGGVPSDPCCIFPCSGTAAALVDTMSLLVDVTSACPTGVLVPVPGPPVHARAAGLAGAVAVPYPLAEEQGWAVDVGMVRQELRRARARCHPKVLCVVNPGDPTGHVLSRQNMVDIIQLVAEEKLLLLADETEQDRAFDPDRPFVSFKRVLWEMGAPFSSTIQIISFYSLSKALGGGGFRAGFFELVNIDPSVLKGFYTWGLSVYPCIVGQVMLETALDLPLPTEASYPDWEESPFIHSFPSHLSHLHPHLISPSSPQQRQRLCHHLAQQWQLLQEVLAQGSLRCQPGQGGARACPRLRLPPRALRQAQELGLEPDVFFCQQLLEATGVLLAPGSEFGQPEGTQHVVVSLLPSATTLVQVLLALTHFYATFIQDFS